MNNNSKLKKRLVIPKGIGLGFNEDGLTLRYNDPVVEIILGIGKDHHATLIMEVEAYEELINLGGQFNKPKEA